MATTAPFGYQKDEKDHNHLVIDEVTAPVVELIFSIAEEGVGLHTICNRLRKAKVLKPSFYKKELFERFMDEEKMYDGDTVQLSADKEQQKKELRQCKQRVSEIENLYAKLYEDLTRELITEKRFQMLSARYDSEQEELTAKIKELEKILVSEPVEIDGQKIQRLTIHYKFIGALKTLE